MEEISGELFDLREKIAGFLKEGFGEYIVEKDGDFSIL